MLEIKKIILYNRGLGFFKRRGKINMSKQKKLQIPFKTNVMNDILKTLSIICTRGFVTGVSYEAADVDTERALEDALIRVSEDDSFISLIKQLIGTQISITVSSRIINGKVLGIQEIEEESIKDKPRLESYLVIVSDDAKIQNLRIKEITGLEIDDPKMQKELDFFLETIYLGKKKDTKILTIFFEGNEEAEVLITYLQEMPSWKTSYRLICSEENNILQGWALIDNILDEDWKDIELSLISGLPISFRYDLYTPNWISRPEVQRIDSYDLAPPEFEDAFGEVADKNIPLSEAKDAISGYKFSIASGKHGWAKNKQVTARAAESLADAEESTKIRAKGEAAGMVGFEYRIMTPITVKRNQSSLVPILQSDITAKKLCVYNEKNHKTNPLQCLELNNDTDLTLERGPISVFDHDAFAGEAMLPFMKQNEKRLIAYSVELGIHVSTDSEYKTMNIHEIRIGKYAETFRFSIQTINYIIKNKTEEEKTLIIEHPKTYKYDLYESKKPDDETENYYRYELTLPPIKTDTLEIKLRRIERQSMHLNQIAKEDILKWFSFKLISEAQRDFLLEIFNLEMQKRDIDNQINKLTHGTKKIVTDQGRLRENLKSLGDSQSEARLKEKYVNKFEQQEEKIEKMHQSIEDLTIKKKILESQIKKKMIDRKF
ncbi:MAG: hypothetical protein ACFFD2_04270 [Promethearchaeota archaeon]